MGCYFYFYIQYFCPKNQCSFIYTKLWNTFIIAFEYAQWMTIDAEYKSIYFRWNRTMWGSHFNECDALSAKLLYCHAVPLLFSFFFFFILQMNIYRAPNCICTINLKITFICLLFLHPTDTENHSHTHTIYYITIKGSTTLKSEIHQVPSWCTAH